MTALLISIGIMCAFSAILALIMIAAELTIGNYGICKIRVNKEKELDIEGGQSLLSSLKAEKVFIPSACGGRGSCGLCKCRVTDGAGDTLPTELPWLDAEERKNGTRLACQVKVKGDISIEIDPELLDVCEFQARVSDITDLTHDIKQITMDLLEPDSITFKAGQFVQIETPEYELTDEPVYRAYSVSSDPATHNQVELEVRLVPNGICTTYVHHHLKVGDPIVLNGPYGDFHLSDSDKEIICIAGGSGMAPIKSILLDMERTGNTRKTTYFFGARSKRDLFLLDEMARLEKALPNFTFIAALSDPDKDDNWTGETGLITEVVARHKPETSGMEAYLCGSPLMIDACIKVLTESGMPDSAIFYDKFA